MVCIRVGHSWLAWLVVLAVAGCSRTHYRLNADRETYSILQEKASHSPWRPPTGFSIQPDVRSRFYDPTPADDPMLPVPAPRLYAYRLPELAPRDPGRFGIVKRSAEGLAAVSSEGPPDSPDDPWGGFAQLAGHQQDVGGGLAEATSRSWALDVEEEATDLTVRPLPETVWETLPPNCRMRMFEFASVREEYVRTWGREPSADQRDPSPRLALEDIVELALINSREYQAQKEVLYRAALRLTLERYDYVLKFTPRGNGTSANYTHNRNGGTTVNSLSVPTTVAGEKVLATGGDLLARFANDVVLTFNGPNGFAADVGSELLFDFSQSVFQRDIVFEGLTQAERNVVYAARNFARFRKQLFRDLAFQYYSLVLTYRGIEIDSQDYFSNLRAFEQGDAEYRAGRLPRFQVDQFEQRALASRSGLIGACNSLERSLDNLKLRIGLPPEMPVNLDLTELEMLTLRDETTVSGELVRRARRNLASERHATSPDRSVLLNASIDLTRRMLDLADLRERLGEEAGEIDALEVLLARLSADEARMLVEFNRDVLEQEKRAELAAPPIRIFQRTMDSVDSLLILVTHQLDLAARLALDQAAIEQIAQRARQVTERYEQVRRELEKTVGERELDRIPELIEAAQRVLDEAASLAGEADVLVGAQPLDAEQDLQRTLEQIDWLLAQSEHMAVEQSVGLVPIEIEMDDAMLTALVQRFDLMNQRGALADTWRQIKLTGDDLRSVLNLNASQAIRTRSDVNRPFDFTFDDSQTRLSLQFDTPLNRKSQRNSFRTSLVNYNVALRNLMELEDQIKLNVRDDLRQLQLDREQYQIAVASAALAHERVVSTRLQLRLGINNVSARDFLEAQQAYTASLSSVASQHIGYLRDRIQLFIDLELLEVDDNGFWPDLYDEQHQPEPDARWPSYVCPYGELPGGVLYSGKVKRMLSIPAGRASAGRRQAEPPPGGFPDLETIDPFLPEEP